MDYLKRKGVRQEMENTLFLCQNDPDLIDAMAKSVAKEKVIYETDALEVPEKDETETKIVISNESTYDAAAKYKGKKVAVLNFANNHNVGGSPFSASAQEEVLCRTSTLYLCLNAKYNEYYKIHSDNFRIGTLDYMGNDDIIYTPDVVVIKSFKPDIALMDKKEWFKTDVITCAAPHCRFGVIEEGYENIIRKRVKRIYDVAAANKVEVLVLGAFGCGAFGNDPYVVAKAFKEYMHDYNFKIIDFAIIDRNGNNFGIFKEILTGK